VIALCHFVFRLSFTQQEGRFFYYLDGRIRVRVSDNIKLRLCSDRSVF